jgi:hypothetical protein
MRVRNDSGMVAGSDSKSGILRNERKNSIWDVQF